jgi:class 3 adenylate cyclase
MAISLHRRAWHTPLPAVHRTVVVVDIEGFGDQRRTNPHRVMTRAGLYQAVEHAFRQAGIQWAKCYHEGSGDGLFVLVPAEIPKSRFVETLPGTLVDALREHNRGHPAEERIRLRMALHAGEITYDDHGVTGAAINLAFRLVDARPLKTALAESPGVLALVASPWFFDEVIRNSTFINPAHYRPIPVAVKETRTTAWMTLPDALASVRPPALSVVTTSYHPPKPTS